MKWFLAQCLICGLRQVIIADDLQQAQVLAFQHHRRRRIWLRTRWYAEVGKVKAQLSERYPNLPLALIPVEWPNFERQFPCQDKEVVLTSLGSRGRRRSRNRNRR